MRQEGKGAYLADYLRTIPEFLHFEHNIDLATQQLLVNPFLSTRNLALTHGLDASAVLAIYEKFQTEPHLQKLVTSNYYPRRLMFALGRSLVKDWIQDPEYAERVFGGGQVMSRTLELHATRGSCDYTCTMCLWSDKEELTYEKHNLREMGLMKNPEWISLMKKAHQLGTRTIIFSGGGEPLLKQDIFELMAEARKIGLKSHLYTNGYSLHKLSEAEWQEVLNLEQIRFSIHSPYADTYNKIVEMPGQANALNRVRENVLQLIDRRKNSSGKVKVGIGFVTQALNHSELISMAEFSSKLGVDFLNLRQDEVSVTRDLSEEERQLVAKQLVDIRQRHEFGEYGATMIDMSDDLVALANGLEHSRQELPQCHIKLLRPAVSPFGLVGPCDLKVEPRFFQQQMTFGNVKRRGVSGISKAISETAVPANCVECMPSGRTGNAILEKILRDAKDGIHFSQQPFNF